MAVGTMECPVCGVDRPHAHRERDIYDWAEAQVGRFGYTLERLFEKEVEARTARYKTQIADLERQLEEARDSAYCLGQRLERLSDGIQLVRENGCPAEALAELLRILGSIASEPRHTLHHLACKSLPALDALLSRAKEQSDLLDARQSVTPEMVEAAIDGYAEVAGYGEHSACVRAAIEAALKVMGQQRG